MLLHESATSIMAYSYQQITYDNSTSHKRSSHHRRRLPRQSAPFHRRTPLSVALKLELWQIDPSDLLVDAAAGIKLERQGRACRFPR
jgi:hypothetical protein